MIKNIYYSIAKMAIFSYTTDKLNLPLSKTTKKAHSFRFFLKCVLHTIHVQKSASLLSFNFTWSILFGSCNTECTNILNLHIRNLIHFLWKPKVDAKLLFLVKFNFQCSFISFTRYISVRLYRSVGF